MKIIDLLLFHLKLTQLLVTTEQEQNGVRQPKTVIHTFPLIKGNGELYYIIDKTLPTSNPYYKVALNKKIAGHTEDFWDVKDSPITDTNNILPIMQNSKMIKEIRNHFAD